MDPEPSPDAASAPAPDADMPIDYDQPDSTFAGESTDAEMGDEPAKDALQEADMVDDDAVARVAAETDTDIIPDDDALLAAVSSAPLDVSFSTAASPPVALPPFSSDLSAAPVSASVPVSTAVELDANPTLAPAPDMPVSADEPITGEPLPAVDNGVDGADERTLDATTSTGDGGAAAHALEPLSTEEAAETPAIADIGGSVTATASAEAPAADGTGDAVAEPDAGEHDDAHATAVEAVGGGATRDPDELVKTNTGAEQQHVLPSRPIVDKDPLLEVEVPVHAPADPSSFSARGVPAVFLTTGDDESTTTHVLFHHERRWPPDDAAAEGETSVDSSDEHFDLLLGEAAQHELYYQPLDKLLVALRRELNWHDYDQEELVLHFDEIGISITEDNVYCSSVTLFDFDRIHTGCQLPGRLHARLDSQSRFSTGFNALAMHIANSRADVVVEVEEDEEGDESATLAGDDDEEEEEGVIEGAVYEEGAEADQAQEEHEEGEVQGATFDEHVEEEEGEGGLAESDGPDSELVRAQQGDEDVEEPEVEAGELPSQEGAAEQPTAALPTAAEGQQPAQAGEDEFDLDSALAQLDGDDGVPAVAQEAQQQPVEEVGAEGARQEGEGVEAPGVARGAEVAQEAATALAAEPAATEPREHEAPSSELPSAAEPQEAAEEALGAEGEDLAEPAEAEQGEVDAAATADEAAQDGVETALPAADVEVDAASTAGELVEPAQVELVVATAELSAVGNDASAAVDDSDEPVNQSDVVIDYDEAFDGGAVTATTAAPAADHGGEALPPTPQSPKRSRDSLSEDGQEGADGESAGDAKRPRLVEATTAA
ncbi:uncharacterized protein JCM10292_002802 [Rhodotorula paludigena]|uniref:uncharacterized protein n=1 Tax=Rhodotorula paludigena TaxID=86838 RepID=UPI00316D0FFF